MKRLWIVCILFITTLYGQEDSSLFFGKFKNKQDAIQAKKIFDKILKKVNTLYFSRIVKEANLYHIVSDDISSEDERQIVTNEIENYFEDDINIDTHKTRSTFTGTATIGFGYSNNIYSHTDIDKTPYGEFEIDNNTSQVSDTFHREIISLQHQYLFDNVDWGWNSAISLYNRDYRDNDNINIFQLALKSGPKYYFGNNNIYAPLFVKKLWYGGEGYMSTYGITPKLTYTLNSQSTIDMQLNISKKRFDKDEEKDWDSNHLEAKAGIGLSSPENIFFRAEIGILGERLIRGGRTDVSYDSFFISGKYIVPLWKGAYLGTKFGIEFRDYLNKNPNLPSREDTRWKLDMELSQKISKDLYTKIVYSHTKSNSNINIYTFKNNTVILNLSTAF